MTKNLVVANAGFFYYQQNSKKYGAHHMRKGHSYEKT